MPPSITSSDPVIHDDSSDARNDGLAEPFGDRVLPFDTEAARHHSALAAAARAAGLGFPTPDGYIAAIAASCGFIVASRDTAPFQAGELRVINPWQR